MGCEKRRDNICHDRNKRKVLKGDIDPVLKELLVDLWDEPSGRTMVGKNQKGT